MKTKLINNISFIFVGLLLGYSWACNTQFEPEIKIVEKTKVKYNIVDRDYFKLDKVELIDKLKCYDTADPFLDGTIKNNTLWINAGLCERKWNRGFKIASGDGFNYYIAGGCLLVGFIGGLLL